MASTTNTTKYSIGDQLSLVDTNGKALRVQIDSIAKYNIANQLDSVDILAASYSDINAGEVDQENTYFYICSSIDGETPVFKNKIFWDDIIDHDNTSYITKSAVYKLTITPVKSSSGYYRNIEDIIASIQEAISANVPDAVINYEDITDSEGDELTRMKKQAEVGRSFLEDVSHMESLRPLITAANSIDWDEYTTNIEENIANISARLSQLDANNEE